jgi:hypothetical protein
MTDELMPYERMADSLIMLLSTDWFLPYWAEIGIKTSEEKKSCVQQGCRKIVAQILGDNESKFMSDFSDERMRETEARLLALIQNCGAELELSETCKEWANLSNQERNAAWNCARSNSQLRLGAVSENGPVLDTSIRSEVGRIWEQYHVEAYAFRDICLHSKTDWDMYAQIAWNGPTVLVGQLQSVLQYRRLREFWNQLRQRLTVQQLDQLVSWYRAMIDFRLHDDRPDLIPSYMQ